MNFRIGHGYDVHRLVPGRKLWLGGIMIPYIKGLSGHSDADVLIHAICDALLGAMASGDIGHHFPDADESFRDIDSKVLLKKAILAGILNTDINNISIKATTSEGLGPEGRGESISANAVALIEKV